MTAMAVLTATMTDDSQARADDHRGTASDTFPSSRVARSVWLTLGGLIAIAALGWGTFNVVGLLAHGEYTTTWEFSADDVRAVDIRSDNGSMTVIAAPVDVVEVTADVSDGLAATDVSAEIVSGVLELRGGCPVAALVWCDVGFTVSVPADRPITIDATDGSVVVRDTTARVDVDNDNGSIEVDGVTGEVRASNDNGSFIGRNLGSDILAASTSNGTIELVFSDPPTTVSGRTSNGRIEVTVPDEEVLYRVEMRTQNGSADSSVRTDPASDRLIDLETDNGSITVRSSG